jgi:hypothetical protein
MNKSMKDQLSEWKRQQRVIKKHDLKKPQKRKSEHLSFRDIEGLMGIKRPTYGRGKGGAIRQKYWGN